MSDAGSAKKKKIIIIVIGMAALAWFLWPQGQATDDPSDGPDLDSEFVNRVWIEHLPKNITDKIDILAIIEDPRVGVFQNSSAFEGDFSLFEWRAGGDGERATLRVTMLQTEKTHKVKYRVSNRDCGRFDLCVRVKGAPRGSKRYVSMEDWVIEGNGTGESGALDEAALRQRIRDVVQGLRE